MPPQAVIAKSDGGEGCGSVGTRSRQARSSVWKIEHVLLRGRLHRITLTFVSLDPVLRRAPGRNGRWSGWPPKIKTVDNSIKGLAGPKLDACGNDSTERSYPSSRWAGGFMLRSVDKVRSQVICRPRVRQLPTCESCSEPMVAPEASALLNDGRVSYVWSCDRCGQTLVTSAVAMA